MGEAKRRAAMAGVDVVIRNAHNGQMTEAKRAGMTRLAYLAELGRRAAHPKKLSDDGIMLSEINVPCGSCRACCYHGHVDLHPEFDTPRYPYLSLTEDEKGLTLRRKADGSCIRLGPNGCQVYEHRPESCRSYDCRLGGATNVSTDFGNGRRTPSWTFDVKNDSDRAAEMAMETAAREVIKEMPDSAGAQAVSATILMRFFDKFPKAKEAMERFREGVKQMSPEDKARLVREAKEYYKRLES